MEAVSIAPPGSALRACPHCESHSVSRSRIRGWVGHSVNKMLGLRPYRCMDCWHRFMAVSQPD